MKEFIEKLIGRLEELKELHAELIKDGLEEDFHSGCEGMCVDIIEIVNELAEEYKDKEYCWQECASTEHCKECSRLGNGDIDYFESIDDWAESLPTIDAGELLGNGWIPCSERLPEDYTEVLGYGIDGHIYLVEIYDTKIYGKVWKQWNGGDIRLKFIDAWQPLPAPYQPKGE